MEVSLGEGCVFSRVGFCFGRLTDQTASAIDVTTANAKSMNRGRFSEIKLTDRRKTGWIVGFVTLGEVVSFGLGLTVGVGTVDMLRPLVGEGSFSGFIITFGINCLLSSML